MPPRGHSSGSSASRPSGAGLAGGLLFGAGRGPSKHSSTSRTSRPSRSSSSGRSYQSRPDRVERPRYNQPSGYRPTFGGTVQRYYGRRHDYIFFPVAWTDADTECWLWYNADVEPAVWQYWYEGISSDYGDYGWMEHYDDGWFIEEDYGSWIPLPDGYDDSYLWYIE